jgi:hypothetical protein
MKPAAKTALRILLLGLGFGLFAIYLGRSGVREVFGAFAKLGAAAPFLLIPYFAVYIVDAIGWRLAFLPPVAQRFVTFWRIRWIGEAVNNLIPSAYIGGEALKVYLLRQRGMDAHGRGMLMGVGRPWDSDPLSHRTGARRKGGVLWCAAARRAVPGQHPTPGGTLRP